MKKIKLVLLTLFLLLIGCSKSQMGAFSKLGSLRKAIINEMREKDVRVMLNNGNCIGVTFINSRFNDEPDSVQQEAREKTLELIGKYIPPKKDINSAWVSFAIHKKYFFIFDYSSSLNTHFYNYNDDGTWTKR